MLYYTAMAKRRTRKQKEAADGHYQLPKNLRSQQSSSNSTETSVNAQVDAGLYAYDPALIKQDIIKTLFVSCIVLAVQLGLYFWLR